MEFQSRVRTTVHSRRRLLRGTAAGAAGAAILAAGCAPTRTAPAPGPAVAQPVRGGVLTRRAQEGGVFPSGFDPHTVAASEAGMMGMFYQGLVRSNPRSILEIEPEIAQRWEQPSQNEYLFTLQPGVKWQSTAPVNGRDLTVDDVVFSLERIRTNQPTFVSRSLIDAVDKIEAVDRSRVKITLKFQDATVLGSFSALTMMMLPQEIIRKEPGKFGAIDAPIGTGAFLLQSHDDARATLVRNPNYWKSGKPYLDSVQLVRIGDENAVWAAFLASQIDIAYVPGPEAKKVFEDKSKAYNAEWFSDVGLQAMYPNLQKKPFDDARVTRALRLLVDHQEAMDHGATWHGRGYMSAALPAAISDWDLPEEEYLTKHLEFKASKDDAAREAASLLGAAGFSRENPLKFVIRHLATSNWLRTQNELLQAQFVRLGRGLVQSELQPGDVPTINTALARGDFEYGQTGMVAPRTEPDSLFRTFFYTGGARNYGKWSDPAADQLIDKQRSIFDVAQRKAAVKDVLRYLAEKAPYTPWSGRYTLNASYRTVNDFVPEGNSALWGFQYEHIWRNG